MKILLRQKQSWAVTVPSIFFIIIGFFTLLIALVNYINLTTARAFDRAREVGVRKVIGAKQGQLITQFLSESVLTILLAFAFAVVLAESFTPFVNNLAATNLTSVLWMGLFGLVTFTEQQRTKEIGIRKVLGANVADVVALLSKDFLKVVMIGFLVAIPIAWYTMNLWLEGFAYRIEMGAGVFLLAGLAAILIALAAVSWQSIKAAIANPVSSLRDE
jgi:ABC-type antimicrobial peptide transport system permease subunit